MLRHMSILLEIMAVLVCIHRLYRKRLKANFEIAVVYLSCMVIYDVIDRYEFRIMLSLLAYLIIGIYCIYSQKDTVKGAMLSIVLTIIIIAILQFVYALPLNVILGNVEQNAFIVNLFVLISLIWILPRHKLHMLREVTEKYNSFAIVLLGVGIYSVLLMMIQEVLSGKLILYLFVFLVPVVAVSFLAIEKWSEVQNEKERIEKALQITEEMPEKYEELLKTIRMRQHEFKNHLAAILAAQYTYKSYDKLIKAQNEYCGILIQENRHHNLLLVGDRILAGFLYGKIQEIESEGINIECQIKGTFRHSVVPIHHLIEMLGIPLDNAAQAVQNDGVKKTNIRFEFLEKESTSLQLLNIFKA